MKKNNRKTNIKKQQLTTFEKKPAKKGQNEWRKKTVKDSREVTRTD